MSTLLFKSLKLLGTFSNLSVSYLSILDFKLAKPTLLAPVYVLTPVAFLKSDFVAYLDKSNSTLTLTPEDFGSGKYSLIPCLFLSIQLLNELL